jgi:hypothetical protein
MVCCRKDLSLYRSAAMGRRDGGAARLALAVVYGPFEAGTRRWTLLAHYGRMVTPDPA